MSARVETLAARWILAAAIAIAAVSLACRIAPLADDGVWLLETFPTEDGYMMLTVARNMALGKGMSVSDGTVPTNGVQPLATVLYAGAAALVGGDKIALVRASLVLQILLASAAAWVLWRLARQLFGPTTLGAPAAALAAALWFAAARSITHTMNGLETGLLCLTVLWTVSLYVARLPQVDAAWGAKRAAVFGAALGVAFLARNDAVFLITAFGFVHLATAARAALGRRLLDCIVFGAVAGVVGSPWMLYNLIHFGSIVPISGRAEMLGFVVGDNLRYIPLALLHQVLMIVPLPHFSDAASVYWTYGSPAAALVCAVALGALLVYWRRLSQPVQVVAALGVAYGLGLGLWYGVFFGAPWFLARFFFPLAAFAALAWGWTLCRAMVWTRVWKPAAVALVAFFALSAYVRHARQGSGILHHAHHWVAANVDPRTWIAATQTGFLGYFHDRTLNLDGKLDPHALKARREGALHRYIEDSPVEYIADWSTEIVRMVPGVDAAFETFAYVPHPVQGVMVMRRRGPIAGQAYSSPARRE